MSALLGYLSGSIVAACVAFLVLFWPALLLIFAWSVRRDLSRIATTLERQTGYLTGPPMGDVDTEHEAEMLGERRISTSLFGR